MKAHLLYRNADLGSKGGKAAGSDTLAADLQLKSILDVMSCGDPVIAESADAVLFGSLRDAGDIRYRQGILRDCIRNPAAVRKLYALAAEVFTRRRQERLWLSSFFLPSLVFSAVNLLKMLVEMLKKLRDLADRSMRGFESEGFLTFFSMLKNELSDDYFAEVSALLSELRFRDGVLISAGLGQGNRGRDYVLRHNPFRRFRDWSSLASYQVGPRDEMGGGDLSQRSARAVNQGANVLAQSADHILGFFAMLQKETAFYIGCLNLYDRLAKFNIPLCFPEPHGEEDRSRSALDLHNVPLSLLIGRESVGNDLAPSACALYVITGANQGGKTTFLRSIGQAQMMLQCGMFVAAKSYSAPVSGVVHTHFVKEEDAKMRSGRLDEELARMDMIVSRIRPGDLLLLNESFTSTNEREGAVIGTQITTALWDNGIDVFTVTNSYAYAGGLYEKRMTGVVFLRAQRLEDGGRSFRMVPGQPLRTGYGEDIYREVFG